MRKIRTYSNDKDLVSQRRDQIVKVAAELIVKKGYNRISTRELAAALGMSTGGLYHYIGSKEDILYLLINFTSDLTEQGLKEFQRAGTGTAAKELEGAMRNYLNIVENYRDFHNFVNHVMLSLCLKDRRIVYEAESRIVEYFEDLIHRGIENKEFKVQYPKLMAHNIVAIANAWANRGWYLRKYYTVDKYASEQIKTILAQVVIPKEEPEAKPLYRTSRKSLKN
ncbi:MAG: TetR/AcrR family transcriptional regulator [Chloroflexi bacterium]|nr:TetR/AcrR family transcriptional regulator [Chloroflexota bacterium]